MSEVAAKVDLKYKPIFVKNNPFGSGTKNDCAIGFLPLTYPKLF